MDGFESVQEDFVCDPLLDQAAVELLKDGGDVVGGGSFGDDPGGRVLNQLEFMEGFMWKAEEKRITIVEAGCDEAVDRMGVPGARVVQSSVCSVPRNLNFVLQLMKNRLPKTIVR